MCLMLLATHASTLDLTVLTKPVNFVAVHLCVASGSEPSTIYEWEPSIGQFNHTASVPESASLSPVTVQQSSGNLYTVVSVPATDAGTVTSYDVVWIGADSDFVYR